MWDLLAFGAIAVDDICYVDHYPVRNTKLEVRAVDREAGGLAGNVAVTAARMGRSAAYCGVLGEDELSTFIRQELTREGVDCSPTEVRDGARPFHSFVIVDESDGSRTILYSSEGVGQPSPATVTRRLLDRCRVLFVDHTAPDAGLAAARLAREAGIPVVADIERAPGDAARGIVEVADHLIIGIDFGREITGLDEPAEVVAALTAPSRSAVVVTAGELGSWWALPSSAPQHLPAFEVDVVDTLGCGDVFHGAYAAALAEGRSPAEALRIATAAAAIKATRRGVRAGIPKRKEIDEFLSTR